MRFLVRLDGCELAAVSLNPITDRPADREMKYRRYAYIVPLRLARERLSVGSTNWLAHLRSSPTSISFDVEFSFVMRRAAASVTQNMASMWARTTATSSNSVSQAMVIAVRRAMR